jgi:hypothetical protein
MAQALAIGTFRSLLPLLRRFFRRTIGVPVSPPPRSRAGTKRPSASTPWNFAGFQPRSEGSSFSSLACRDTSWASSLSPQGLNLITRLPFPLWHRCRNARTIGDDFRRNVQKPGKQHHVVSRQFPLVFPEFVNLDSGKRQEARNVIPRRSRRGKALVKPVLVKEESHASVP